MSTSDLHARAARFFLLAEQSSRLSPLSQEMFWELSTSSAGETATHLPALATAVRKTDSSAIIWEPAFHLLPGVLPPEAVPWFDNLVEAWEVHRASSIEKWQELARRALVRLDGCGMPDGMRRPSRLPEWLAEARGMVGAGCEPVRTGESQVESHRKLEALAALAAWCPARGVITPPEALREWVAFWQKMRQSGEPILKGIAARALLNLPEADLRAASIPPVPAGELLRDLAAAIPVAAEKTAKNKGYDYLIMLDWQPEENSPLPAAGVAGVARCWLEVAWLEVAWPNNDYCRWAAWWQLIRWDRTGSLAHCGIDLLPFLVRAVQTEKDEDVLWEMARWRPTAEAFTGTEKPDGLNLLRQLETSWQQHRQSWNWWDRAPAWLAGIRLHQTRLASEPPERFQEAYLSAVAQEDDGDVLLVLAQWSPDTEAPAAFHREWRQGWQSRSGAKDEGIRHVAVFALLRRTLGNETGEMLWHAALEMWRTGPKEGQATGQILNAALSRFHEVRMHLAAGRVPDFKAAQTPPAQRQYPLEN